MPDHSATDFHIRTARPEDVPEIHDMIGELADFERLRDQFVASIDDLTASFFGPQPPAGALVAENAETGALVGYAIFFTTFSTFLGKAGLWLEDIYIRPAWRGQGAGKKLLLAVAEVAKERGSGRYEWCVLDWNQRAIDFYEAVGATVMPDWRIVRVNREGIERLANRSS
ncbi:MAG: GNAT family N-acetyltransferase [Verrucomicrobiae bacterium]|nr:GNAT family N-acetyltransferase [Verrucomicrobiae bacterium]